MGRKRQRHVLDMYVGSSKVGTYSRHPGGSTSFCYDPDWLSSDIAFPISASMPLSDRVWSGETATNYFDGLLPDNRTVREKIASTQKAESAEIFDLLVVLGRDCVGAMCFVPEGLDPGDTTNMEYRSVSDDEIAARIDSLKITPLGVHVDEDDFRISIAGVQEKTAFLRINNQWQLPLGPTPSSHIFKPAMKDASSGADFSDSPWNEWLCLELCRAFGLESAKAEVLIFDDKPVIVIERFDRTWRQGVLYRLPQEDMCQALGVSPVRKYQSDGGPGIVEILDFLHGAIIPYEDRVAFMKTQVVFWLLAAIDGHAKNFSIFLSPNGYRLTPVYDVISATPWAEFPDQKIKLAMTLGNKKYYRLSQIQPRHFYQTGHRAGLRKQDMDGIFASLTARMNDAIAKTAESAAAAGAPTSTAESILSGVSKRAKIIENQ